MNQSQQNVRVLMCTQCGAPIQTSQQGGSYTCEYCGAALQVGAQRSGPISFQSAQDQLGLDPEQMEAARLKSLKKQADHYDASNPYSYYEAPDDLEYIAATDELDDSFLPMALQAFKMATDRCHASSCALPDQRRVYWLAKKLKNSWTRRNDALKARAVIETAHDMLTDPGYQQLLKCSLADLARKEGDLAAAENWLSQCDPRPPLIDLDSEYRTSWAMLLMHRERWQDALAVVGERRGLIPYEPASVAVFNSVRVGCLERLGRTAEAENELRAFYDDVPDGFLENMYSNSDTWVPAREVLERLKARGDLDSRDSDSDSDVFYGGGSSSRSAPDVTMPDPPPWWIFLPFSGLIVGGGFLLHDGYTDRQRGEEMAAWQVTDGEVIETGVEAVSGDDDTTFYPIVVYEYTVDDVTYSNDYIGISVEGYNSSLDAEHDAERWEQHDPLRVYYDPDSPADAALDITPSWWAPYGMVLGAVLIFGFFVVVIVFAIKLVIWLVRRQKALAAMRA